MNEYKNKVNHIFCVVKQQTIKRKKRVNSHLGTVPAKVCYPFSLKSPKINTALPRLTIIPFIALVSTLPLFETLFQPLAKALYLCLAKPLSTSLCSRPGPEGEACVGVTELTGLSALCPLCRLFPFPLFTATSTAAAYPTVSPHTHHTHISVYRRGGSWRLSTGSNLHRAEYVGCMCLNTTLWNRDNNLIIFHRRKLQERCAFLCPSKESPSELWIKRHCAASYTRMHILPDSLMVCIRICVLMCAAVYAFMCGFVHTDRQWVTGPTSQSEKQTVW